MGNIINPYRYTAVSPSGSIYGQGVSGQTAAELDGLTTYLKFEEGATLFTIDEVDGVNATLSGARNWLGPPGLVESYSQAFTGGSLTKLMTPVDLSYNCLYSMVFVPYNLSTGDIFESFPANANRFLWVQNVALRFIHYGPTSSPAGTDSWYIDIPIANFNIGTVNHLLISQDELGNITQSTPDTRIWVNGVEITTASTSPLSPLIRAAATGGQAYTNCTIYRLAQAGIIVDIDEFAFWGGVNINGRVPALTAAAIWNGGSPIPLVAV